MMITGLCVFSGLAIAYGIRLSPRAGVREPSSHTPIGLVLEAETLNSFMTMTGRLGEGGQATVYEFFIGGHAEQQSLQVESLKNLEAMADELIAADDDAYNKIKSRCSDLLNFIEQHYDRFGTWAFSATKSHVQDAKTYLNELIENAERDLKAKQSSSVDAFADVIDSLESKENPYAPNFRALRGQRVAAKMSSADDSDEPMLLKEVVFGTVLRSASGDNWKLGGYLGFLCVDMGGPSTNKTSSETEELCFSRFCPHGTMAFIFSEKFPGDTLYGSVARFKDDAEATSFVKTISDAVSSMHDHGVTHGDLAQRNVMFSKPFISIIDLGYARFCGPEAALVVTSKFYAQGLFQGVIDSAQCHFDKSKKTKSMLAHTRAIGFQSDSLHLKKWLPEVVHPHLEKCEVIAKIPSDACPDYVIWDA